MTEALAKVHGDQNILATDITAASRFENLPYLPLNVLDALALANVVTEHRITQIYHLAAVLSAAPIWFSLPVEAPPTTSSPTLIGSPPSSASTRVYSFEPTEAGSFCIRLTKSAEGARKLRAV